MKILTDNHSDLFNSKALLRGKMIFTSILGISGKWIFLDDHLNRLLKGADFLYPQAQWSNHKEKLKSFVESIEQTTTGHTYLRLSVIDDYLLVTSQSLDEVHLGVNLMDATHRCSESLKPAFLKLSTYALADFEVERAKSKGFDDVVFFDHDDRVCEASTSNIFIVDQAKLVLTPPISSIVLDGVLRKNIIEFMNSQGVQCTEKKLSRNDLLNAREIWLTNSIKGLRKVIRWNQHFFDHSDDLFNSLTKNFGRYGEKI